MEFNSLDYIITAVLLLSALIGYNRGFIASVIRIIGTLAGLGIAFWYKEEAAAYLQQHLGLVSSLAGMLEKRIPIAAWVANQPILAPLPGIKGGMAYLHGQFMDLSNLLVIAGCFLLLFIISSKIIRIIGMMGEKIFRGGILGGMNRLAGAGIVMIKDLIIMAALLGVFYYPLGLGTKIGIEGVSKAAVFIQDSALVPYLLQVFVFMQEMITGGV